MTLAREVNSSGRCSLGFLKVSTEQMLRPQQERPAKARGVFKTNSMSSAYITSMVEANGRRKVVSGPRGGGGERALHVPTPLKVADFE